MCRKLKQYCMTGQVSTNKKWKRYMNESGEVFNLVLV